MAHESCERGVSEHSTLKFAGRQYFTQKFEPSQRFKSSSFELKVRKQKSYKMLNIEILDLFNVEQLEEFYAERRGPQNERLLREEARQFRQYLDARINQVNLIILII